MGTHVRTGKPSLLRARSQKWIVAVSLFLTACSMDALIDDFNKINTSNITGYIANYSANSSQASAQSLTTCTTPVVNLYKLDANGERIKPAAASTGVDETGAYTINLQSAGFETEALKTNPMLIEVNGCSAGVFFRPITGYSEQNVNMSSSLLGFMVNTDYKAKLAAALQDNGADLQSLMLILGSPDSMQKSYEILVANTEATDKFTQIFGVGPEALLDASPEVTYVNVPSLVQERVTYQFEADSSHWSPSYTTIYEWKKNASSLGAGKSFSFAPGGNSQGNHTLTLYVGQDDGSGHVNTTKPNKVFTVPVEITNNVPPQPPSFTVTSPSIAGGQPVNTRNLVIGIQTGAALANCDTFSSLVMTESSAMPSEATNFPIVCTQNGTQSLNVTLSAGEGAKTLYLWAKDASGLISSVPTTLAVVLDTVTPTVTISTQPLAQSKSSSQVFAFTGNDGSGTIDRFECKIDADAWTSCSSPLSLAGLAEGDHTFNVRAVDTAGNISTPDSKTWHIDLTAPTLTLAGPPAITNSLSSVFTLTGVDTGGSGMGGYQCSLDSGGYASCTAVVNYVLVAGSHTFKARAYDVAGNVSNILTHSWTIDTTPPIVTITSKPSATTNATTAAFGFVGTDSGGASISGYECELDAGGFAACTTGKSYSALADGSHTFKVRATDTAGNLSAVTTYTWVINTVTPMASITSSPDSITNQTSATFAFFATPPSGGSIASYQCKLDGGAFGACTSPHTYNGLVQGTHTFTVHSVDNLGNDSDDTSYTWVIDTTNPTLTITDHPALSTNSATAQFKFTGADTGGGAIEKYYCDIDGGGFTECASPKNLTSLAEGSHTFQVKVMDTAGNTSTVASYTWSVDLTSPVLTLLTKPNSLTNQTTASFTFSASDAGSISGYECKIDGGTAVSCVSGVSYSSLTAGAHNFEVVAIDDAGNYSSSISYSWTIDLTAPTVTITAKPAANSNSSTATFSFTGMDTGGGAIAGYKCKIDGGAYSTCMSGGSYNSLAEGSHTVYLYASDTAGNDGTPISYTFVVDTVAPTLTITTPASNGYVIPVGNVSAVTFSGACSEEGLSVTLTGVSVVPVLCSSGAYTIVANMSSLPDGTYTISAVQVDAAGNSGASSNRTVIKDATAPTITVTTPSVVKGGGVISATWTNTEANVAASSSFTVELYDGTTWTNVGTKTATAGANSAVSYSLTGITVPVVNTGSAKIRVSLTDAAGNAKTTTSGSFAIDSSAPTLSSFTVNGGAPSTTNNNVLIGFNGTDSYSNIAKICMQMTATAPTAASNCWIPVNSYGLTAAKNLVTSSIYYNVGLVSGTFNIYIWLMDAVGNISTNAATAGVDKGSVVYNSPNPPGISAIQLTSTDTPNSPPAGSDLIVGAGQAIYLKWNITSTTGLATNPIKVTYTTDDATEGGVLSSGLANAGNGGCNVTAGYTGCAVFTAPVGTYFRLKIQATDSQGFFTTIASNPLNSGKINFLAGNTDLGLNSSAKSAIIKPTGTYSLAVLDDGRIFVIDTRGLAWVNPATGVYEILATTASSASGDGGVLTSAKFKALNGIWVDSNNDVLVADSNYIRKINTKVSPMTISRFIGGGTDTSSYVAVATNYKASVMKHLTVASNGDIYFTGENGLKVRKYTAATGAISLITLSGTGNSSSSTQNNALCTFSNYFVSFDSSGIAERMGWSMSSGNASSSCPLGSTSETKAYAQVDPTTGVAQLPAPSRVNSSTGYREYVDFYNDKSGNLYTGYSNSTNAQGIFKFEPVSMTWTRIYGSANFGTCADGTAQENCGIVAASIAFNSQGQLFYIDGKSNAVRTIDYEGKVRTLVGDRLGSDDGKNALVSRFANLTDVKGWTSSGTNYITMYDFDDVRIREFTPGGSLTTLAGQQYSKMPTNGSTAATNPLTNVYDAAPTRFVLGANGDIYMPRTAATIAKISRATGNWEDLNTNGVYGPGPVALSGNKLLVSTFSYNGTLNSLVDSRLSIVDTVAKTISRAAYDGSTSIGTTICADGSLVNGGCAVTGLAKDESYQGAFDVATNSWLVADTNGYRIASFALDASGNMSTLFTAPRAFSKFAINRTSNLSVNHVYICSSGSLYKYDLNNSGAETLLALPNSTFTCDGPITYDSNRNSLLFVYKQNGLQGVAEVVSP
ncbi:hypothetical protein DOM22_07435 [Bdellovibrio sp. ZAP7]|uniref:Ig-like domain-containing protein n=1 Tax=Bdellovibrio sp. ZAP7 TaxID=2231053 RepID=UPI0011575775|nr:Ig-like domain-containing protein [Bdellovibrio sp. ZAP7]QDK45007.1 hypothetical protein DOM22_07435 [Bdellovibrio sp. ZAP7]